MPSWRTRRNLCTGGALRRRNRSDSRGRSVCRTITSCTGSRMIFSDMRQSQSGGVIAHDIILAGRGNGKHNHCSREVSFKVEAGPTADSLESDMRTKLLLILPLLLLLIAPGTLS